MPSSKRRLSYRGVSALMQSKQLGDLQIRYEAALRAANRSEKTIQHYADSFKTLHRFLRDAGLPPVLDSLTTETVQLYVSWLVETPRLKARHGSTARSVYGVAGRIRDLKAFLNWLTEYDLLDRKVKVPKFKTPEPEFAVFSDEELATIFDSAQLTTKGQIAVRNRAIFMILLDSGVRLGELVGLTLADVEFEDYLLKVTGKGRKTRRVPFSPTAAEALTDWLKIRGREPGSLFGLSYFGVRMLMRRVEAETGIHIHPHRFRHTACTKLIRAGKSSSVVRRIMGHAHIATTEIYVNLNNNDLREQHHSASPVESIGSLRTPQTRKRRLTTK